MALNKTIRFVYCSDPIVMLWIYVPAKAIIFEILIQWVMVLESSALSDDKVIRTAQEWA